jgi:putative phosphoribosyl transferase
LSPHDAASQSARRIFPDFPQSPVYTAKRRVYAGEMANRSERHEAVPHGPPAFRDRAEAGVLLAVALREAFGNQVSDHPERIRGSAGPAPMTREPAPAGRAVPAQGFPGPGPGSPDPEAGCEPPPPRDSTENRGSRDWLRVLAIPRGGVAVGAEVARALGVPLDVIMVRKLGHPEAPELGLGAIAEGAGGAGEPFFDEEMLDRVGLTPADMTAVVARERAELARRVAVYRPLPPTETDGPQGLADLARQVVIVVDDGLATGVTARAALRAARARGAARTVLAVPVAAPAAAEAMKTETGEVVTLVTPRRFRSVGEWYADFAQLTDDDVLTLLSSFGGSTPRNSRSPAGRA